MSGANSFLILNANKKLLISLPGLFKLLPEKERKRKQGEI